MAARRWGRRHEEGAEGGYPAAVVRQLDRLDIRRSAFVGVLIQPRTLTVAAALVVAREESGPVSLLIGFVAFAVVSTAALLGILVYVVRRPERATLRLADVVAVLERQAPVIITVLFAGAGGYLVARRRVEPAALSGRDRASTPRAPSGHGQPHGVPARARTPRR